MKAQNSHKTSFDPILDDYAFFEAHSTEAENDLKAYAACLSGIAGVNGRIRMLDFGSGIGSFTGLFLKQAGWLPENLELTLVEPGEIARRKAVEALRPFTHRPIAHFAALPAEAEAGYSLILSNHTLYYPPSLGETIARLYRSLRPGGKLLAAMSGMENALVQCWDHGFRLIGEPIPYHIGEGLQAALDQMELKYQKDRVDFTLSFPDSTDNRLRILRFLFGVQLPAFPIGALQAFFDPYAKAGQVRIDTGHYLYSIFNPAVAG